MPKRSAGLLLHARAEGDRMVLVVHPSGPYNRAAPYSLPKGEPEPGEALEDAARRETREEVGIEITGPLRDLGYIDYRKSKKRVFAWAAALPAGAVPRCASWEIDRAEVVPIERARELLHPEQRVFLDRFVALCEGEAEIA
jgi:predicted NUDIX family NTP pyrophosphohydrolase